MTKAISKLTTLEEAFKLGGGPRGLHRHCVLNKKLAPRLAGYSMSYGDIPAGGAITAIGLVNNRLCLASANDATVKGGTVYPIGVKKSLRAQEICGRCRIPSVHLVDSGGAFLPLQSSIFPDAEHGGRVFYNEAILNSRGIPQLALVLGSSTAGGAYVPTMSDEVIMVDKISHIFLGGPPLVQAALGEKISAENLGGAAVHSHGSGCSDHFVLTEYDGFSLMREIISTLPSAFPDSHANFATPTEPLRRIEDLNSLCINQIPTDAQRDVLFSILSRVVDSSILLEFKPTFSSNLVCGFARLSGRQVGILGSWSCLKEKDAVKGAHFIEVCSHRKIPLIFFIHTSEDPPSDAEEDASTLRAKSSMMSLVANFKLPKLSVLIGDASGPDYWLMCGKSMNPSFILAWPNARFDLTGSGFMDSESGSYVCNSDDERYLDAFSAAGNLYVDDVIHPSETRKHLISLMKFTHFYDCSEHSKSDIASTMLRF